jgi:hypothetical protein
MNLPFFPKLAAKFFASVSALVILHLSFPVISNFTPGDLFFSRSTTLAPHSDARNAAIIPAGPAPIIARSYIVDCTVVTGFFIFDLFYIEHGYFV